MHDGSARPRLIPGRVYERPLHERTRERPRLHTYYNVSGPLVAYLPAGELARSLAGCEPPAASDAERAIASAGQRVLISVRHRLLFCPIEKVALSAWVRGFFAL